METPGQENFLYGAVLPNVERMGWLVTGAGLLLRCVFLQPGGNTLLMTGLGTLAIVYFLRAFEPSTTDVADEFAFGNAPFAPAPGAGFISKLARQALAFGSALTFIGTLSKLLFWGGAVFMLPAGISLLLLVIAWQSSVGSLARQTVLITGLGVITWTIPTDALARQLFRNDPTLVEKLIFQHNNPHDQAATKEVRRLMSIWYKRKH